MASRLKIVVNPKYERFREEIARIPDTIAEEGTAIFSARNTIYRANVAGADATVKAFHVPAPLNRVVYSTLRHSKARRSFDNAMRLLALGISTPEPIAYIEETRGGLIARSYYVCLMFEGRDIRRWELTVPAHEEMVDALARFTLRLHRAGVLHKDFSPGNILFRRSPAGEYEFSLIDINRMRFGVTSKRRLLRNFRCLNIESETETARVAERYALAAGLDPDRLRRKALAMLRAYHREKARHRALRRCLGLRRRT